jgi:hypothetical protein
MQKLRIVILGFGTRARDRKRSLNDGQIPNPSNPFGIVPQSNFVPRDFGFVHHSIAILYHEVPNPNLTIRNFFIAVTTCGGGAGVEASNDALYAHGEAAGRGLVGLAGFESRAIQRTLRAGFEQRQRSEPRHCRTQHGSLSGAQCVSLAGTQTAWGVGAHESICVLRRAACGIRHTADTLHQPHVQPVHRLELFHDWDCQVNLHQPTRTPSGHRARLRSAA